MKHPMLTRIRNILAGICLAAGMLTPLQVHAQLSLFRGGLRFNVVDSDALYREYAADPFSISSGLKHFQVTKFEHVPTTVRATNGTEYIEIPFVEYNPAEFENKSSFWQIKGSINLSLARLEITDLFAAEIAIAGGLNSVFQAYGGTDTLGFDGIWRLAGTVRLFDAIAIRYGNHHFSGHWGDEPLSDLPHPGDDDYVYYEHLSEYVRNNSYVLGVDISPEPWFRLYFEAEVPIGNSFVRPGVHVPTGFFTPGGDDLFLHIMRQEGFLDDEGNPIYIVKDLSYKAYRFQTGAEIRLPLGDWGSLFLAGDYQMHQDGQTLHQIGGYSPDNPWETEYTIGGGLEYEKGFIGRKIRLEYYYHSGRFPLLNYFYQRADYFSFGLAINN